MLHATRRHACQLLQYCLPAIASQPLLASYYCNSLPALIAHILTLRTSQPMDWKIEPGHTPGTYRIKTTHHAAGGQPAGWGLSAWHGHGAKRNDVSSWVAVHEGDHWPMVSES